jgi:hypothetical protein
LARYALLNLEDPRLFEVLSDSARDLSNRLCAVRARAS